MISDEYFDAHNVFFQQSASKEHLEDLLSICNNDIPEVTQSCCKILSNQLIGLFWYLIADQILSTPLAGGPYPS